MSCFKTKHLALREMNLVLDFFESEIQDLENQKHELRVQYHCRPLEERNIMKDILAMHNEFEKDVTKLKTMTAGFSKVPLTKSETIKTVEKRFKDVAEMQESIIKFQEAVQNLLICKVSYQTQNEDIKSQVDDLEEHINSLINEIYKLQEYDDNDIYIEKYNFLIEECEKLTYIILFFENEDRKITNELSSNEIIELNDTEAINELRRVVIENAMLKEAIDNINDNINKPKVVKDLMDDAEVKRCKVDLLKEKYKRIQEEIKIMECFEEEKEVVNEDFTEKIMLLDMIIGMKNDKGENISPRVSFEKKPSLLDDVIVSFNKARIITSPVKGK
ncbi:hypothetical protein SteCoe_14431 [Stentor coeruleus]|uniref:Uncharacterized protein n=1 Tax=Stentor coeruleus TaxID=5963 RepID=A0A1R2BEP5_9CILI|nr:hypothetical protein SteCoe_25689 [Stentor coeruleus]OMJ84426.1 hypothetical protein SteCoe_14431 [Stentor coeruleus]